MDAVTQIYYWPREFVLRSHGFVQARSYRRASISVLLAGEQPFAIDLEGEGVQQSRGLVLGPLARRSGLRLLAEDYRNACWILDLAPGSPTHRQMLDWLRRQPVRALDEDSLAAAQAVLAPWREQAVLDLATAQALHRDLLACVLSGQPEKRCDERVLRVLSLLDVAMLDEVAIAPMAQQVNLSESRLRSLVRRELGCNLAQYARWAAAWKTILHWQPGRTLTDAAHAAGFHDLAHANHAANDMFGLSPSRALDSKQVALFAQTMVKN